MDIPLTSLSWMEWLVTADWLTDHEQVKKAAYARRVGNALKKLTLAGVDVRCAVAFKDYRGCRVRTHVVVGWSNVVILNGERYVYVKDLQNKFGSFRCRYEKLYVQRWYHGMPVVSYMTSVPCGVPIVDNQERPVRGEMWWITPKKARWLAGEHRDKIKYLSPADLHEPDKHVRFIRKFWRLVVIRASGVPDREVVDGKGDRV